MTASHATKARAKAAPLSSQRWGVIAACAALLAGLCADLASADPLPRRAGEFNTPYGQSLGEENRPVDPRTRDWNGNRTIINGRILTGDGSSLPPSLARGFVGQTGATPFAQAIGNQLNVVVQGNRNTVIVDATQINNGDVEAGVVLNGELDLDD